MNNCKCPINTIKCPEHLKGEWKDPKKELPSEDTYVLIYTAFTENSGTADIIKMCYYRKSIESFVTFDETVLCNCEVTCWCELPFKPVCLC